jgi:hypothetical protein
VPLVAIVRYRQASFGSSVEPGGCGLPAVRVVVCERSALIVGKSVVILCFVT